jgi:hypothetical protein
LLDNGTLIQSEAEAFEDLADDEAHRVCDDPGLFLGKAYQKRHLDEGRPQAAPCPRAP